MTNHLDQAFLDASEELADELRPSPSDIAKMIVQYAVLKKANRITLDGEVIERKKANREESRLNDAIKKALVKLGEDEMYVEGTGLVRLRETDAIGYRLDVMSADQLNSLLDVLMVKRSAVTEEIDGTHMRAYKPEWAWLREYEVRGHGSVQLLFEEERSGGKRQ